MPRPRLEKELRKTVREYLAIAENLSVEEGPLNTLSVAPQLGFNREKLKKYGFDVEIARASERQGRNGKMSPRDSERRSYADKLHQRDSEIEAMRQRCKTLVSRVCLAEGNSRPRNGSDRALETAFSSRPEPAPDTDAQKLHWAICLGLDIPPMEIHR
jgi:hypothetical protein